MKSKSSMIDVAGPDSNESDSLPEDLYGDSDDGLSPIAKNSNDEGRQNVANVDRPLKGRG